MNPAYKISGAFTDGTLMYNYVNSRAGVGSCVARRNLQAPDMLAENKKLNLSREAAWQAMKGQGGGNGVYAFLSVLCGGSGGGGGGNMFGPNPTSSAPEGGDAGSGVDMGESGVTNNSSEPIMVKPEGSEEEPNPPCIILEPGETYYGEIDGFTFPFAEGLEVYKVTDPFAGDLWEVYDDDIDMDGDWLGAAKEVNDAIAGEVTPLWIINDLQSRDSKYIIEPTLGGWRPMFEFNYYEY